MRCSDATNSAGGIHVTRRWKGRVRPRGLGRRNGPLTVADALATRPPIAWGLPGRRRRRAAPGGHGNAGASPLAARRSSLSTTATCPAERRGGHEHTGLQHHRPRRRRAQHRHRGHLRRPGHKTSSAVSNIQARHRSDQPVRGHVTADQVRRFGPAAGRQHRRHGRQPQGRRPCPSTAAKDLGIVADTASAMITGTRINRGPELDPDQEPRRWGGPGGELAVPDRGSAALQRYLRGRRLVRTSCSAIGPATGGKITLGLDQTGTGFTLRETTGGTNRQ